MLFVKLNTTSFFKLFSLVGNISYRYDKYGRLIKPMPKELPFLIPMIKQEDLDCGENVIHEKMKSVISYE